MATIIKKMKGGKAYFYLVESARVDGKPRIVNQVYLGKADDVLARLGDTSPPEPARVVVREFGASVAAYDMAKRIGLEQIVDEACPKRKQGVSVGTYLTVAAANRVAAPCSKRKMGAWYAAGAISTFAKLRATDLAPQRFWDAMGRVGKDELATIDRLLGSRIIDVFGVDTSALVLDATNFFTFIDSATESELARRGHSKAKRHDLRQIGLALVVSVDHSVPLASLCYPGNLADCTSFATLAEELIVRYRQFALHVADITLVFDKGNNSAANLTAVGSSGYHFVGSLVPTHHKELLEVDLAAFRPAAGLRGVATWRTQKEVFGVVRTLVVTYSEELAAKQRRGLDQTLAKACASLADTEALLVRGRYRRKRADIARAIDEILEPRWLKQILSVSLDDTDEGLRLTWHIDEAARADIDRIHFGKRILFTDRTELSDEQIVRFYRTQNSVESAFRQMKDPSFLSFSPMFHWTDDKIRVHVFYCVVALAITNLMWRRVRGAGIDISPKAMLAELADIKLVDLVYPPRGGKGRPRVTRTLSDLSDIQRRLLAALDLEEYMPVGNTA